MWSSRHRLFRIIQYHFLFCCYNLPSLPNPIKPVLLPSAPSLSLSLSLSLSRLTHLIDKAAPQSFFCHFTVISTGKYVFCIPPPSVPAHAAPFPCDSHLTNGAITVPVWPNTVGTHGYINKCYPIATNYRRMVKL